MPIALQNGALCMFLCCIIMKNFVSTMEWDNSGQPLFLTPYIESGDIATGRALSRVGRLPNAPRDVLSYSGYFTVNKKYNSNTFFWFFPALNKDVNSPFLLWLQGGPGQSGLLGLFVEHGPYFLYNTTTAGLREQTWNKEFHVLYVDSPVGTGFSFTDDEEGYATNQDQITEDLYEFLQQFFLVYHEYGHCDFYITGESYGGKHVPYLGYKLHVDGSPANLNFKGISIGNGMIDNRLLSNFHEYLYYLGLIDDKQAIGMKNIYDTFTGHLDKGENYLAAKEFNKYVDFIKDPDMETSSVITNFTGFEFFYNFLHAKKPEDYTYFVSYIQTPMARRAIHVGNLTYHDISLVRHYLKVDFVVSSSLDKISFLVDKYKVLIYSGQLDVVLPYVLCENLLMNNLTWSFSDDYRNADRKIWRLVKEDHIAGYVKHYGNLSGVLVRNAGHMVPHDQPEAALDLMTKFVNDLPYV